MMKEMRKMVRKITALKVDLEGDQVFGEVGDLTEVGEGLGIEVAEDLEAEAVVIEEDSEAEVGVIVGAGADMATVEAEVDSVTVGAEVDSATEEVVEVVAALETGEEEVVLEVEVVVIAEGSVVVGVIEVVGLPILETAGALTALQPLKIKK